MDLLTIAWAVAGLLLALNGLRWFIVSLNLLRLSFAAPRHRRIDATELPEPWRAALAEEGARLLSVGFTEAGACRATRFAAHEDADETRQLCFVHEELGVLALLGFAENPEPLNAHSCTFHAFDARGTYLLGMNGEAWAVLDQLPNTVVIDPYAATIEEQWQVYRQRLSDHVIRRSSVEETLAQIDAAMAVYLDRLVEKSWLVPSSRAGRYEMRTRAAARNAWSIIRGSQKLRTLMLTRQKSMREAGVSSLPSIPVLVEVEAYRRLEAIRQTRNRRLRLGLLFGITAVAFVVSFLQLFELETVLILLAVIFFHELGHYSAMRLFGYRDTTIFFIPFLGAAASGRKEKTSLHEEIIVLLAGPIPGLVVGLCVYILVPSILSDPLGRELLLFLLFINLLNLLPVFPLDGGKVVDALVLTQRPFLSVIFRGAAAVVFLLGGVATGDWILLGLGFIVVVTIPHGLRAARLEKDLISTSPNDGNVDTVFTIFERMRALGMSGLAFSHRIALARQLEPKLERVRPRLGALIAWIGAYAGSLVLGVMGSVYVLMGAVTSTDPGSMKLDTELECRKIADEWEPVGGAVAQSVLATFADDATASQSASATNRALSREVFVAIGPTVYGALLEDEVGQAEDSMTRLSQTARASWLESPRGETISVSAECETDREETARLLEESLALHGSGLGLFPIRPAWIAPSAEDEEEQSRARHTVALLQRARTEAVQNQDFTAEGLRGLMRWFNPGPGDLQEALKQAERMEALYFRRLEEAVDRHRGDPQLDPELAAQILEGRGMLASSTVARALGLLPHEVEANGWLVPTPELRNLAVRHALVESSGRTVRIRFIQLWRSGTGIPALFHHMCRSGCESIRYRFQSTRAADFADEVNDL